MGFPSNSLVHCRSHLLQLALVRSATVVAEVKRTLSMLNKLYAMFSHSPKRLSVLQDTQVAIDGMAHKLVQPGDTRWLSYDGSVAVVCKHYGAICIALEAIYADAGNMSCDAGGLLLQLRKSSTIFLLCMLNTILQPLARLSKVFQSSTGDMSSAMMVAKATIAAMIDYDYASMEADVQTRKAQIVEAGVFVEEDMNHTACLKLAKKFIDEVVKNVQSRFSDKVSQLCELHKILKEKPNIPHLKPIADLLCLDLCELTTEWNFLRRLDGDLSSPTAIMDLALSSEKRAMFPAFSKAATRLLLLPLGTANVERSFSSLNRILCSKRCRLNAEHVRHLMLLSVEGIALPDVRNATADDEEAFNKLLDKAYNLWLKKPRRVTSTTTE